jgi:hypothetical protein
VRHYTATAVHVGQFNIRLLIDIKILLLLFCDSAALCVIQLAGCSRDVLGAHSGDSILSVVPLFHVVSTSTYGHLHIHMGGFTLYAVIEQ